MFSEIYAKHYESLNQRKLYKQEIEFIWEWARNPRRILDLGCGTAKYWKHYPRRVEVFGIEQSEEMIKRSPYKDRIFCQDITEIDPFLKCAKFDAVTALFDVLLYVPQHEWWKYLPIKPGGYFVFDIWNKDKVINDGFKISVRIVDGVCRIITPIYQDENKVRLSVTLTSTSIYTTEIHEMFLYSFDDILDFAGNEFDVVDVRKTEKWQTFYKLKRK